MCFSAEASFAASGVLLVAGVASLRSTNARNQVPFAAIPLLFAVQQFSEGFVWLSLTNSSYANWGNIAVYTYLVFAQIFWPAWVPFSIYLLEKNPKARKILVILSCMGGIVAAYLAYRLIYFPVQVVISSNHIKYLLKLPYPEIHFSGGLYLLSTMLSPFASSVRKMLLLGIVILMSYIVARLFFGEFVISVWCYFAAMCSAIILLIIYNLRKSAKPEVQNS
ncbi:MAG: DUF6629 family protein [Bacteroidia bacterium]